MFSSLPLIWQDYVDNRTLWTHQLHTIYGSIVRLSPNEVSISSQVAIEQVYHGSAKTGYYSKGPIYDFFRHYGEVNSFSALHYEDNVRRRKSFASLYLHSTILGRQAESGAIWKSCRDFRSFIERDGIALGDARGRTGVDLFKACQYFAADCMMEHLTGRSMRALTGDMETRRCLDDVAVNPGHRITYLFLSLLPLYDLRYRLREMLRTLKAWVGFQDARTRVRFRDGKELLDLVYRYFLDVMEAVRERRYNEVLTEPVAAHLAASVLGRARGGSDGPFFQRPDAAASECADQFLAGLETLTDTLCYIFLCLSSEENVSIQESLIAESKNMSLDAYQTPSREKLATIERAPILDAVVKETLRLFPATTTAMTRVVPPGGRCVGGFMLPSGTLVGATTYTVNRDAEIFDPGNNFDVAAWRPARWNNVQPETRAHMERRLWTFGSGERNCIGKSLAMLQIKMLLVSIYSNFSTRQDINIANGQHGYWASRNNFRDVRFFKTTSGIICFQRETGDAA